MIVISVTVNALLFCRIIRTALLLEGTTTLMQRLNILHKHNVPLQTLKPGYEPFHQHFLFYTCMPATLSIIGTFFQIFHIYYRSATATIINLLLKSA